MTVRVLFFVLATVAAGVVFANDGPGTYFVPAEGTANVVDDVKANPAAKTAKTVAFVGGSITEMHGYRPRVMAALRAKYPDVSFTEVAAGVSSTCSDTGAFRLEEDVLSKCKPDLFFVEESVNDDQDGHFDRIHAIRGMEGIIRRVRQECPSCTIVVGLMVNSGQYKELMAGKLPFHNRVHREVAAHYGAEVADVGAALAKSAKSGGFSWKEYRDCHPSPEGCDFAAKVIMEAIDKVFDPKSAVKRHALPPPMDEKSYFRGEFVSFGVLNGVEGWQMSRPDWTKVSGGKRALSLRALRLYSSPPLAHRRDGHAHYLPRRVPRLQIQESVVVRRLKKCHRTP